ncbi:MAG: nuclear transport factor 2 family protein [Acidobacteriota bacterium]
MNRAVAFLFVVCSLAVSPVFAAGEEKAVAVALDALHASAARADETAYFELFAPDGVFFGTDASERWARDEFREWAHPHFASGRGWKFAPRDRHIYLSPDRRMAWFDERLDNASYGECRGTGVLRLTRSGWRIEQYNLSIPIPNALASDFVARIRAGRP